MPKDVPENYKLERRFSLKQLLIGIFGAMAICGVMAKIFNFEAEVFGYLITWKPVVLVGFIGEAFVFILMGLMREMRYVPIDETDSPSSNGTTEDAPDSENAEVFTQKLKTAKEELTEETERLAEQIHEVRKDLSGQIMILEEFNELRQAVQEATDSLSDHSEMLGSSMEDLKSLYEAQTSMVQSVEEVQKQLFEESKGLGDEIAETRKAMRSMREQSQRASDTLSEHSDILRSSMEDQKALYEAQTSMVQSVEEVQKQLSKVSEGLGDEIVETRKAMKGMRKQLTRAARRFEQFNNPVSVTESSANERANNVSNSAK